MASLAETLQSLQDSMQGFDINDLDFENIGSWPLLVKVIVWVIIFSACVFGGYKFVIEEYQGNLARVTAQEEKLRQEFKTKAFQAANLDAYRKQMEEMEESFGALVGQLPSDTEVPGLLEDITNKGVGNGLDFASIDLKPEKNAEFYVELPIDIVVEGAFHDMGTFVSGVAGLPRIVTLHDFVIQPVKDEKASSLIMNITAKTYRYKEEEDLQREALEAKKARQKKRGRK
jgi:type IV pilus assembly protein PilO